MDEYLLNQSRHKQENPNQSMNDLANVFDQIDPINPHSNAKILNDSKLEPAHI